MDAGETRPTSAGLARWGRKANIATPLCSRTIPQEGYDSLPPFLDPVRQVSFFI